MSYEWVSTGGSQVSWSECVHEMGERTSPGPCVIRPYPARHTGGVPVSDIRRLECHLVSSKYN